MDAKVYAAGIAAVVLVGATVAAFVTGMGPAPGGDDPEVTEFPTATPTTGTGDGASGGSTTTADTATPAPSFASEVERIERCGRTCRDVTATVSNEGDAAATGVTVYTRIFAGNGTDGDPVWRGKQEIGTLEVGESVTETQRVELSYAEGLAVERADGWITVQTTIEAEEKTVTATERRNVG